MDGALKGVSGFFRGRHKRYKKREKRFETGGNKAIKALSAQMDVVGKKFPGAREVKKGGKIILIENGRSIENEPEVRELRALQLSLQTLNGGFDYYRELKQTEQSRRNVVVGLRKLVRGSKPR